MMVGAQARIRAEEREEAGELLRTFQRRALEELHLGALDVVRVELNRPRRPVAGEAEIAPRLIALLRASMVSVQDAIQLRQAARGRRIDWIKVPTHRRRMV